MAGKAVCQVCGRLLEGKEIKKATDGSNSVMGIYCLTHATYLYNSKLFARDYSQYRK